MSSSTLIDVLRHGEPVGGARYRGRTDDALTENGWRQMCDTLNTRINRGSSQETIFDHVTPTPPWTQVISSPLKRCAEFAHRLCETHQLELQFEPRFSEIDFGDWEGLTSQEIMASDSARLSRYWENPMHNTPPNGEPLKAFNARVMQAWKELLATQASTHKPHLLIITHGGTLRLLISQLLDMPHSALFNLNAPYACLSRLQHQYDNQQSQLIFHNAKPR